MIYAMTQYNSLYSYMPLILFGHLCDCLHCHGYSSTYNLLILLAFGAPNVDKTLFLLIIDGFDESSDVYFGMCDDAAACDLGWFGWYLFTRF